MDNGKGNMDAGVNKSDEGLGLEDKRRQVEKT